MIDGDEVGAGRSWLGFVSSMFRDFEVNRARAFYSRTDNELEVLHCCHGKLDSQEFFVIGREKSSSSFFFFFNHCEQCYSNVENWQFSSKDWKDTGLELYREFLKIISGLLRSHFKIEGFRRSFRNFQNHFIQIALGSLGPFMSLQDHSNSFELNIKEFQMLL